MDVFEEGIIASMYELPVTESCAGFRDHIVAVMYQDGYSTGTRLLQLYHVVMKNTKFFHELNEWNGGVFGYNGLTNSFLHSPWKKEDKVCAGYVPATLVHGYDERPDVELLVMSNDMTCVEIEVWVEQEEMSAREDIHKVTSPHTVLDDETVFYVWPISFPDDGRGRIIRTPHTESIKEITFCVSESEAQRKKSEKPYSFLNTIKWEKEWDSTDALISSSIGK